MSEETTFPWILRGYLLVAAVIFPVLFFKTAPYGRHAETHRGPTIDSTIGWVIMESPSVLVILACYFLGVHRDPARLALLALWELHYVHRTYIWPFRRKGGKSHRMPIMVVLSALTFTSFNGYLNGRWLFTFSPADAYSAATLSDPRFLAGAAMFLCGFAINVWSDQILFDLRKPGESGYKIPTGGFYRLVSCPNYMGEILEWSGFALAAWSLPALGFALWTVANLLPRAVSNHRWYKEKFADYPRERKAVIPFVL